MYSYIGHGGRGPAAVQPGAGPRRGDAPGDADRAGAGVSPELMITISITLIMLVGGTDWSKQ